MPEARCLLLRNEKKQRVGEVYRKRGFILQSVFLELLFRLPFETRLSARHARTTGISRCTLTSVLLHSFGKGGGKKIVRSVRQYGTLKPALGQAAPVAGRLVLRTGDARTTEATLETDDEAPTTVVWRQAVPEDRKLALPKIAFNRRPFRKLQQMIADKASQAGIRGCRAPNHVGHA